MSNTVSWQRQHLNQSDGLVGGVCLRLPMTSTLPPPPPSPQIEKEIGEQRRKGTVEERRDRMPGMFSRPSLFSSPSHFLFCSILLFLSKSRISPPPSCSPTSSQWNIGAYMKRTLNLGMLCCEVRCFSLQNLGCTKT